MLDKGQKMANKILIVGQLPPPYHGSNVMAKNMLEALQKNDYQIEFIDKSLSQSIEMISRISIRKLLRAPILAVRILIACLFRRPRVCMYFISFGKIAFLLDSFLLLLLRMFQVPYILRFGGKGAYDLQSENSFWKLLISLTLKNALGGIVKGEQLKWDVNLFIPNERLIPVPNAIHNTPFTFQNGHKDYVQILFLSNLVPSKGPLEVLKASKIVIREEQNVRFILAGRDWKQSFSSKLRSYTIDNKIGEYVNMPGGTYGKAKEKLLASSDIFVFPTRWETFGIVNLEAMRAGLPVISSSEGAIPEVVQNGVTGFIVNPESPEEIADKILSLVRNPSLRKNMGMKGREVFETKYTLETYAKTLDGAIRFFLDKL